MEQNKSNSFRDDLIKMSNAVLAKYAYEYNTEEVHTKIENELKDFAKTYRQNGQLKEFVPICDGIDNKLILNCAYKLKEDDEFKILRFMIG